MTTTATGRTLKVLVYSDDALVRADVITALGTRPSPELPAIETVQVATAAMLLQQADLGGYDLVILDGEAVPYGGMGLARQLKDEIFDCPPTLVLIARQSDAWLATWSRADGVAALPVNALELPQAAAALLRERIAGTAVVAVPAAH